MQLIGKDDFQNSLHGLLFEVVTEVYTELGFLAMPAIERALRQRRVLLKDQAQCIKAARELYPQLYPRGAREEIEKAARAMKRHQRKAIKAA